MNLKKMWLFDPIKIRVKRRKSRKVVFSTPLTVFACFWLFDGWQNHVISRWKCGVLENGPKSARGVKKMKAQKNSDLTSIFIDSNGVKNAIFVFSTPLEVFVPFCSFWTIFRKMRKFAQIIVLSSKMECSPKCGFDPYFFRVGELANRKNAICTFLRFFKPSWTPSPTFDSWKTYCFPRGKRNFSKTGRKSLGGWKKWRRRKSIDLLLFL